MLGGSCFYIALKYRNLALVIALAGLTVGASAAVVHPESENVADDLSGPSGVIISKYLRATELHPVQHAASMQVDIDASVPKLRERASLKALRQISRVGRVTYRVLGFQGDNTVKSQVIARYLEAEQQSRNNQNLGITPANYKFKYKGSHLAQGGEEVYVFQLSPRAKRVGLFKGEIWLNAVTYLPVLEKGRLVKNPSIFFKKIDFEQAFVLYNGAAIPERMSSTIDTRLIGKVQLNINYSNFADDWSEDEESGNLQVKPVVYTSALP